MGVKSAEVEQRRIRVAELWLKGVPTDAIGRQLHTPTRTIRNDLRKIREAIRQENQEEIREQWNRSLAVLRKIQQEAWTLFHRVDDRSVNKASALNAILGAEDRVMKLQGIVTDHLKIDAHAHVSNNDTITETQWESIQSTIIDALRAHPEAAASVSEALLRLGEGGRAKLN